MLGNMDLLARNSPLWGEIKNILTKNGELGPALPLRCNHHLDSVKMVMNFTSIERYLW